MKPLWIFGFVVALSFLAPLAQAAPLAFAASPEPARVDAAPPSAGDDHQAPPPPHTAPVDGAHEPGNDVWHGAQPQREHGWDHNSYTPPPDSTDTVAPAVYPDEDSAAVYDDGGAPQQDTDADSTYMPSHYSMDDLVDAMQDLDSSY